MSTIPNGYKLTEVGVIPSDWEVKTISEISRPVRGGSPRPAGDLKYFNGDFIPWLTVAALTNIPISQIYVSETENHLTQLGALYSRILEKETLIIANSGATLGVAKLLAIRCCANDGIAALLDFDKKTNKKYLVHFINTKIKYLREVVASGNGQPNLNTELIGNIKAPFPPNKDEQTAIANTLSDADALITQLEKLIDKKRNIKQGAMQELLRPKVGWDMKKLGDIIHLQGGYAFKSELFTSIGIPIIRISDVGNNKVDTVNSVCYEPFNIPKEFVAKKGDVLIAMSGATTGKIGVYNNDGIAYINQRVGKFVVLNLQDTSQEFVSHIVSSERFKENLSKEIAQGAQPNISGKQIQSIILPIPKSKTEQTHIAQILTGMDAEIEQLEKKLEKYKMMKQGMMQNLLTGKIRLV